MAKGDDKQFNTPEKAYAEAERRIAEAQRSGATELSVQFRYLRTLPPSLTRLTALTHLDLDGTPVSDLTPLARLTALTHLWLSQTQVSDLTPLTRLTALTHLWLSQTQVSDLTPLARLTDLTVLDLDNTQVSDLTPLTRLTDLTVLDLDNTQVSDLTPLTRLTALTSLDLGGTQVSDLTPLTRLTALTSLWLGGTQVSDLTPLVDHIALSNAAQQSDGESFKRGLRAASTPITKRPPFEFEKLLALPHPASTIETINYLRRQLGKPPHIPEGYTPLKLDFLDEVPLSERWPENSPPSVEKLPQYIEGGFAWGGSDNESLKIVTVEGRGPLDTSEQREFYDILRSALVELQKACPSGNNRLRKFGDLADRLDAEMPEGIIELKLHRFWAAANALRHANEAERAKTDRDDLDNPAAPADIKALLRAAVDSVNLFSSGDPTLVSFDLRALDPERQEMSPERRKALGALADEAKQSPAVVNAEDAKLLEGIVKDGDPKTASGRRADQVAERSMLGMVFAVVRRAVSKVGGYVASGAVGAMGVIYKDAIAKTARDFLVKLQGPIEDFVKHLPYGETLAQLYRWLVGLG